MSVGGVMALAGRHAGPCRLLLAAAMALAAGCVAQAQERYLPPHRECLPGPNYALCQQSEAKENSQKAESNERNREHNQNRPTR